MPLLSGETNKKFFLLPFSLFLCLTCLSQAKHYTVADAHANNDYMHPVPFYTAWNGGFGSIEADVYAVNGVLLVSHTKKALSSERTLDRLLRSSSETKYFFKGFNSRIRRCKVSL